jgi:hypothetical protein
MRITTTCKLKVLAASLALAASAGAVAGNAITAQGIMVNLAGSGDFGVTGTTLYRFNPGTASGYFSNTWNGVAPTANCTGGSLCSSATAPAAPAAPAPDPGYVDSSNGRSRSQGADQINECSFFRGGTLSGRTYMQTASVNQSVSVVSGRKTQTQTLTWTFTYTYNVTPLQSSVDSLTAWDFWKSNGDGGDGSADIDINADIAGESVVISNQYPHGKYSFSLNDAVTPNRVQNLVLTVSDVNGVFGTATPGSTVYMNYPNGSLNFDYVTNAGSNGSAAAKVYLQNGNAMTILNSDTFAGNNNGGADGSALAKAVMDTVSLTLPAGDYNVQLTGLVKGNSAIADYSFSVSSQVHIIGVGCGQL